MEELSVQFLQCLLKDGVGRSSFKTKLLEEVRIGVELGHEGPIPESGVELESKENKESWEWEVGRTSEGGGLV